MAKKYKIKITLAKEPGHAWAVGDVVSEKELKEHGVNIDACTDKDLIQIVEEINDGEIRTKQQ